MPEQALDWCRAQRFSCVITWPTPRSRPFYRRGGFDRLDEPFIIDPAKTCRSLTAAYPGLESCS